MVGFDGSAYQVAKMATDGTLLASTSQSTTSEQVIDADDTVQTYTWLDFGTTTERLSTLVYTSATVGSTVTDTFAYTLVGSSYRLDTITRVVT